MVVGVRGAEVVDLGRQELRGLDARHAIEGGQFVEAAVEGPLGRGAIVAENVVDQRVADKVEVRDRVDEPANLVIRLLQEARVELHLAGEHRLEVVGHLIPARDLVVPLGQFGVLRNHAQLLLLLECLLPQRIPAVVELALVLVRPHLGYLVRGVGGTGGEVHEERLVRRQRLLLPHPGDGPVRQILGERVALLGRLRRLDRRGSLEETGIVLIGLATDETVEVLETRTGGPLVEWAGRGYLPHRHLVTLAELARRITVEPQRLRDRCLLLRPDAAVPRCRGRHLGDGPHAHRVMVAPGQQGLPGGRTQCGGVKAVELEAISRQSLSHRRVARPAERRRRAKPDIVDQHDQHIRRSRRGPQRGDRRVLRVGILGVVGRKAYVFRIGNGKVLARQRSCGRNLGNRRRRRPWARPPSWSVAFFFGAAFLVDLVVFDDFAMVVLLRVVSPMRIY